MSAPTLLLGYGSVTTVPISGIDYKDLAAGLSYTTTVSELLAVLDTLKFALWHSVSEFMRNAELAVSRLLTMT